MANLKITVHMIVKNEDRFIWYAIKSVLDYIDKLLIFDTGSKDNTVEIIKNINSPKIDFEQKGNVNSKKLVELRQEQIEKTKTDWIWIVDGDEIYPDVTIKEILKYINQNRHIGGIVRRFDLLGDIYHYQDESVGSYHLLGMTGHLVLRCLNIKKIDGLHLKGLYPNEGYYDRNDQVLIDYPRKDFFFTRNRLFHAMYLERSSLGRNLLQTLHRRKYKIEEGNYFSATEEFPNIFFQKHPQLVSDVTATRDVRYDIAAKLITPIKKLKRNIFNTPGRWPDACLPARQGLLPGGKNK